jgi:hypothetical protein
VNLQYNTSLALVAEAQRAREHLDVALAAWERADRRLTRKLRPGQRHTQAEKQALADAEVHVETCKREYVRSARACRSQH